MAFTEEQKVDIRFYLGYPDVYRQLNTRLESAIEVVGTRPASQAKVETILSKLNFLFLGDGYGGPVPLNQQFSLAGINHVESADDIIKYGSGGSSGVGSQVITDQRRYGKMLCGMLSKMFGVPLAGHVFSENGYEGDNWVNTTSKLPFMNM